MSPLTGRPIRTAVLVLAVVSPLVAAIAAAGGYLIVQQRRDAFESRALDETRSILIAVPDGLSAVDADRLGAALRRPARMEVVLVDASGVVSRSSSSLGLADVPRDLRAGTDLQPASRRTTVGGTPYFVVGGATGPERTTAAYLFFSERSLQQDTHRTALVVAGVGGALLVLLVATGWWLSHRRLRSVARLREHERAFTAHLGHELRTPVGAMVTAASLIDEPGLRRSPEQVRQPVEVMQTQARRLRRIVEDLMELSRLETGQVEVCPEVVNVASVAETTIATYGWGNVRLELDGPSEAWTDPHSVARLFLNLVTNAVAHAEHEVVVSVGRHDDVVVLEVVDDGPGMPASIIERAASGQGTRTDRPEDRPARGLGLLIARAHAALIGTRLEIDAGPGSGTRIRVRFPAAAANVSQAQGRSVAGQDG